MKNLFILLVLIMLVFSVTSYAQCDFILGDVNDNGKVNVVDYVYFFNYLLGGPVPPYSCVCMAGSPPIYVAADVNGSCSVNGLDALIFKSYFFGISADLWPCICNTLIDENAIPGENMILTDETVEIWFGNVDGSPIEVSPGDQVTVDVFMQTTDGGYTSSFHLPLAVQNQYISSMLSETLGQLFDTLATWEK